MVNRSTFEALLESTGDKRWREITLLTVNMLPNADCLIQQIKQHIDSLLATDKELQQFLIWVMQKASSVSASYKAASVRAFYLALSRNFSLAWDRDSGNLYYPEISELDTGVHFSLARELDRRLSQSLERDTGFLILDDRCCDLSILLQIRDDNYYGDLRNPEDLESEIKAIELEIDDLLEELNDPEKDLAEDLHYDLLISIALCTNRISLLPSFSDDLFSCSGMVINRRYPATPRIQDYSTGFAEAMKQQLDKIPSFCWNEQHKNSCAWWKLNRNDWVTELRTIVIKYRNISYDWRFTDGQKELLQQYYDANKLLIDCLNSDCYVSRDVRQEIEETLLLPISEIEARKQA